MYLINGILFLAGILLALAYDDLSNQKNATQSTTYTGAFEASKASHAVDGNRETCMRTEVIDNGLQVPDQTVWWKVDLGGVYNIYSVNILFKNYKEFEYRQRGRFAGFSLYVSTTGDRDNSSLCYKDGQELPPLNFTTTCITSGRYVTYYNERLKGVTYPDGYQSVNVHTELCEVTVSGCRDPGVYGGNCDVPCPLNCRDNVCHIQEGTCFGCTLGWTGTKCGTVCPGGRYGVDCKHQCSGHCRDHAVCNHTTGHCDRGCSAGWTGYLCNKGCADGTYGNDCMHNCSKYCLSDSPCNKTNGHCKEGCKPGYSQPLCNEHCSGGHYGNKCEKVCSDQCRSNKNICNPVDGTCIDGCKDGYTGNHCNTTCTVGYYGPNCSHVCSSNCKSCKHTDGTCSCPAGLIGPNCSIVSEHPSTSCLDSHLSALSSGLLGAFVSAFVFLTTAVVIYVLRRKSLSRPKTKSSPYAEIGNHQSGDSTYQELTVTELDKTYQNLALQ